MPATKWPFQLTYLPFVARNYLLSSFIKSFIKCCQHTAWYNVPENKLLTNQIIHSNEKRSMVRLRITIVSSQHRYNDHLNLICSLLSVVTCMWLTKQRWSRNSVLQYMSCYVLTDHIDSSSTYFKLFTKQQQKIRCCLHRSLITSWFVAISQQWYLFPYI